MSFEKMLGDDASFEDRIRAGMVELPDAERIQTELTGEIHPDSPGEGRGGMWVDLPSGERKVFQNTAAALEWVHKTGGLIMRDGKVTLGERMQDKFARIKSEGTSE